jgi:hypothetical protein
MITILEAVIIAVITIFTYAFIKTIKDIYNEKKEKR